MNRVSNHGSIRLGPVPRFRFRPGHYGLFAPFVALVWMMVLIVEVCWYSAKLVLIGLTILVHWLAMATESSERSRHAAKN